jgi:hypothetical protein
MQQRHRFPQGRNDRNRREEVKKKEKMNKCVDQATASIHEGGKERRKVKEIKTRELLSGKAGDEKNVEGKRKKKKIKKRGEINR